IRASHILEGGTRSRRSLGLGTEFDSLRDYHPDDDPRRINWRATARAGRPISHEFRVEQDRPVVLLLDTGRRLTAPRPSTSPDGGVVTVTRLEVAFGAAVALAQAVTRLGDRVGVIAYDREIRTRLPARRRDVPAVLDLLVDLHPRPVESDHLLAFAAVE